jgi:hypothetical protein
VQIESTTQPSIRRHRNIEPISKTSAASESTVPSEKIRKSDVHTERVTLPVSPDMRDRVDAMARELQRVRTKRGESITSNTVMRAALRVVLERVSLQSGDSANTEEEVFALLSKKLRSR